MSRAEAWAIHLSTLLVGGTGVVYAWMRYALEPPDPWAVVHHPWQPAVQHLHVWLAPALVFAAGAVWRGHAWPRWRGGGRRLASGVSLMAGLAPMVASGYLLQTAVEPAWRSVWVAVHLAASGLWLVAWGIHALRPLLGGRRTAHQPPLPG